MADESISIQIADKVSPSISQKLEGIETKARSAHDSIERLNAALASIQPKGLAALATASSTAQRELDRAAVSAQRLSTEQQRTAAAAAGASAAQQRVAAAAAQAGTAQANLATATARTQTEQARGAQAAQRVATEQQRTATASAQAAAAADRAALAALRLKAAEDKVAIASERSAAGIMTFVRSAAGLIGLTVGIAGIIHLADVSTLLKNKLANLSESTEQSTTLLKRLYEVANETRSPIEETVQAFQRFDNSLKRMGTSQEQTISIVGTLNKIIAVSGANASEAANGMVQLSQAFGSGRLQGQDLRAILEDIPGIALQIASKLKVTGNQISVTNDTIGISIGQFRKLAHEGKLTSEVLRDALLLSANDVQKKFEKTVPTIGQSFTILKNRIIEAFGSFNQATGFSRGLSAAIVFLSNNLGVLGVAAAIAGAAMLVYFGPVLLTAIGAATTAVWEFTLAVASNPIGLIAVAISAAIAAIAIFGDKIKVTSDGAVTLKDLFRTAWAYIADAARIAATVIEAAWKTAIGAIKVFTQGWGVQFNATTGGILDFAKSAVNAYIGLYVGAFKVIMAIWDNFPGAMNALFVGVVNFGAKAVEMFVNSWQIGFRLIAKGLDTFAPDTAAKLNSVLDNFTVKLPRMENSESGKAFVDDVQGIIKDAFNTDYIGNATDAFMKRAREIAAERKRNEKTTPLRPEGTNPDTGDTGEGTEKRARALMLVNKALDDELSRMFLLKPEREVQAKFDQIESELLRKKITLSAQEADAIKKKIANIEQQKFVQQEFDRIYEASIEPARTKNAVLAAANKLLAMGAITQAQYNAELLRSNEAYKESTQAFYAANKELDEQVKLLTMLPRAREVEQQVIQKVNEAIASGKPIRDEEINDLRKKLTLVQQMNEAVQIQNALIQNSSSEQLRQTATTIAEIQKLLNDPAANFSKGDASSATNDMLKNMGLDTTNLQVAADANVNVFQQMYDKISQLRQADLISERDATSARMQVWVSSQRAHLAGTQNFLSGLAQLQSSHNKTQARIGKAAAIANATINTYLSATEAFAAMASIPYVGPILGAIAAAAAVASGLAQIQQIRSTKSTGYMAGGYTGDFGVATKAGDVHGREFVSNAQTTAKYRPYLEAMHAGTFNPNAPANGSQAPAPNVNVRVVNVKSHDEARDFANSDENEMVVLNIMHKNGLLK